MPNMFGGDQCDEDYAPHLYYGGKMVGEEKAERLRARDEKKKKDRIRTLLDRLGLNRFDYEANGYAIGDQELGLDQTADQDPWNITKEGFTLGIIVGAGYIKISYKIGLNHHEPTVLRQVELAGELATELRNHGCNQLIELPPRTVVIPKLEEIIKYSRDVAKKFKSG